MTRSDPGGTVPAIAFGASPAGEAARRATALAPALAAALLGIFVLYAAGFAGPAGVHNAAHDVRHSVAFPCH